MCGSQKITCESWFSPSITWVLDMELGSSGISLYPLTCHVGPMLLRFVSKSKLNKGHILYYAQLHRYLIWKLVYEREWCPPLLHLALLTTANFFLLALVLQNKTTTTTSNLFCYLEQDQAWQSLVGDFRDPGSFSTGKGFPKLPTSPNIHQQLRSAR